MEASPFPPERAKILIVDDREENLIALRAILNDPSYEVLLARGGDEALRLVLRHEFALIIMDVLMAGMDGYETATAIRSREKSRHIPVIFLTAMNGDIGNIFRAYGIGAVDYIQKPVEAQIVRAKVAVFADLFRMKRRIQRQEAIIREHEVGKVRRASQKRYEDLVEGIAHGFVWSADPDTLTFNYVSPRARLILGYPLESWFREPGFWEAHLHPEDRSRVMEAIATARAGKEVGLEHRFITVDGDPVWLHSGIRLARKGEGAGFELRGLSVDISHLKSIEAALREAVQVREDFLAIASHELKTPITPLKIQVQGLVRALKRSNGPELPRERIAKTLETMDRQIDRLTRLIEELLDVSRLSAGRLEIALEPMVLGDWVREVVEQIQGEAERSGCEIVLRAESVSATKVTWDRTRVTQVLMNLLTNALKYGAGKPVEIGAAVEGERVRITVRDWGVGIPQDETHRIFGRFERARTSAGFSGLGLGLYISKKIAEAHGGDILVKSAPGEGSTFTLELPVVAARSGMLDVA